MHDMLPGFSRDWERLGLFVSSPFPITRDKTKLVLGPGRLPSVQVGYVQ